MGINTQDQAAKPPTPHLFVEPVAGATRPNQEPATEADWQTVTTDRILEPRMSFNDFRSARSGLSFPTIYRGVTSFPGANTFYGRVDQNPPDQGQHIPSYLGHEGQSKQQAPVPKPKHSDRTGFLQNSLRQVPKLPARTAAYARRLSAHFLGVPTDTRRAGSSPPPKKTPPAIELQLINRSWESLHSHNAHRDNNAATQQVDFSWPRIRQNTGTEAPKQAYGCWDQPLCGTNRLKLPDSPKAVHVPHDEYLQDIPGMHFPLMSLQEAALMQQFRRDRGAEDHTEAGREFSDRVRSYDKASSNHSIQTVWPSLHDHGAQDDIAKPAPLVRASGLRHEHKLPSRTHDMNPKTCSEIGVC